MTQSAGDAPGSDLTAYAPFVVRSALARLPDQALPLPGAAPAALLFADISGFTPLTERLMARGPEGVETLSALLDSWFGAMVDRITEHGGDVLKFAGDALMASWLVEPGGAADLEEACARAAGCALALQAQQGRADAVEGVTLSFKLAIGAGELRWMQLGDPATQRELFVAGQPQRQVATAQRIARSGEVVLAPEAWAQLVDRANGEPAEQGHTRLQAVNSPTPRPLDADALPPLARAELVAFVPRAVRSRLEAGQAAWLAELRPVSIVFVNLPTLNEDSPPPLAQRLVLRLLELCERYEGALNKLSVDDKGASLLVVFGLPPMAHQDDPSRALAAAVAISEAISTLSLDHSIGVATGRAYCGTIGSDRRREYTVLGDVVNLAARLMLAASGACTAGAPPILCDGHTHDAGAETPGVVLGTLAPIQLKGKAKPVPAWTVESAQTSTASPGPSFPQGRIIGRKRERAALESHLERLVQGRSSALLLEGEAGIGKTCIVQHVQTEAQARDLTLWLGGGESLERARAYGAWRGVMQGALQRLGLGDHGPEALVAALDALLPGLTRITPLLESFLPLGLTETEHTANMSGELRADNTQQLATALMRRALDGTPAVLIMEDAQWLDSASWALLARVSAELAPLLLVVTTRPMTPPEPAELLALRGSEDCESLILSPLETPEALELAARSLGVSRLPAEVEGLISARAEGHPFFSEELAYALRDAGLLSIRGDRCTLAVPPEDLETVALPDTLQGAITARIDRLEPQQQLTLKVASVIGRRFAVRLLAGVHPIDDDRPRVPSYLEAMTARNLTRLTEPAPRLAYSFEHAVTQDVAYQLMAFAQRRRLHRSVAEWLEGDPSADDAQLTPHLAHHWLHAVDGRSPDPELTTRALHYLDRAGERSLQDFANKEAVAFFEQAVGLDERAGGLASPAQRAGWERRLGQAFLALGQMPRSRGHLERAIGLLDRPVPGVAGLLAQLTLELLAQLRYQLGVGRAGPKDDNDRAVQLEAARSFASLFVVRYQANQSLHTVHSALRGFSRAERAGALSEMADALASICLILGTVPLHGLARRYGARALDLAEQAADPSGLAWVLEVLGVYFIGAGRWDQVQLHVGRAAAIADDIGDGRRWEETHAVLAWLDYFRGDASAAADGWRAVAEAAEQRRDPQPRIWGLCGLVETGWLVGAVDEQEALQLLRKARSLLPDDMYRAEAIRVLGVLATMEARSGDPEAAAQAAVETLGLIRGLMPTTFYSFEGYAGAAEVLLGLLPSARGRERDRLAKAARRACRALRGFARVFPVARPRARLLQGLEAWQRGRSSYAVKAWRRGLTDARRLTMPLEELRLLATMAHYGCSDAEQRDALAATLEVDPRRLVPWSTGHGV